MSQSLDLPKNITSFYFWCKIQVLLYIKMKIASHTSIITALKFTCCSSLSVSYEKNCFILRTVHIFTYWNLPSQWKRYKPFPIFYTFQALIQTDLKEKLFKALMPAVLCFFIFWKESRIFATVAKHSLKISLIRVRSQRLGSDSLINALM